MPALIAHGLKPSASGPTLTLIPAKGLYVQNDKPTGNDLILKLLKMKMSQEQSDVLEVKFCVHKTAWQSDVGHQLTANYWPSRYSSTSTLDTQKCLKRNLTIS